MTPRQRASGLILLAALLVPLLAACTAKPTKPAFSGADEVHGPLGESLDQYLHRLEALGFSGSALVAQGGKVVLNKGYGFADRARRKPYTAGTIFDVASISKQFTAAAILKLEMEGKLKVEDPIGKFFPAVPDDKTPITLHMLLTHTSGLTDVLGDEYEPVSRDEMVRRAFAAGLVRKPGKKFHYSNAGFSLLAAVVEIASKEPYEKYLREHLFAPAGMRDTGFHVPDRAAVAHGYTPEGDWGTPFDHPWAPDGPYWNLRGNGGILSTTGDLYRWHLAMENDSVLSRPEREKYITPFVSQGKMAHASYGYGWGIGTSPKGGRLVEHIGGNLVFDSDFRRYLDEGIVLIMSSNSSEYSAISVTPHLENRVFGLPDPEPPVAAAVQPAVLASRAGVYALPSGERLEVRPTEGRLAISPQGSKAFALLLGAEAEEDRHAMAEREQQVAAMLTALHGGDAGPWADLRSLPPERAEQEAKALLAPWQQRLGAWKTSEVLGNESHGGHPYTYARLTFDKGTKIAEYLWSGMGIETTHFLDAPPPVVFVPQADGSFASYDVRTGSIVKITFEEAALVAHTPSGEVKARRIN